MDWRLELVTVPVSDVDRAKAFYVDGMGFTVDQDARVNEGLRFVQLTPPGSPSPIAIGQGISSKQPGSMEGLQMVVHDITAARELLVGRGVAVTEIEDYPWGRFFFLKDPDGNGWSIQQPPGIAP
jgi:catechol 2,3-dioxygenase-like lactoylglutathione lyase family enzyme